MSHRHSLAPILHKASRGVHPRGPAPFFPQASSLQPPASARRALTLIEMLVALAVTLVMMAAVVNLFANISGSIRNRRAMIEVGGQIRQVRQRLALDLEGATCAAKTWQLPSENRGYIEIIEGQWSDSNPSIFLDGTDNPPNNPELDYATSIIPSGGDPQLVIPSSSTRVPAIGDVTNGGALGDHDDILALTVRSEAEPFKAQVFNPVTNNQELVESTLAEVLWFAVENDGSNGEPGMRTIYRRVLLIVPSLGPWTYTAGGDEGRPPNVSVRLDVANSRWIANTLGDLTKRENRIERRATPPPQEPFPFPMSQMGSSTSTERIMLSNALAFDLRVFDPGAPLYEAGAAAVVQPGDPGWFAAATATGPPVPVGFGAYCDLGWGWDSVGGTLVYPQALPLPTGVPTPRFNVLRQPGWHPLGTSLAPNNYPCVYDTWSYHYENDGINQDEGHPAPVGPAGWRDTLDQGANGLDDDNLNGVDDMGERETSPPYDTPLRGVKVVLRIYETDARQVRETSVTHSFAE